MIAEIQEYIKQFEGPDGQAYRTPADRYLHHIFKDNARLRTLLAEREETIVQLMKSRESSIIKEQKKLNENAGSAK